LFNDHQRIMLALATLVGFAALPIVDNLGDYTMSAEAKSGSGGSGGSGSGAAGGAAGGAGGGAAGVQRTQGAGSYLLRNVKVKAQIEKPLRKEIVE
jgi:hypothetical protein